MLSKYTPAEDGKTHVNIYSGGKTIAGKFASNFAPCFIVATWEINNPLFHSVEAYWYWLGLRETLIPRPPHLDHLRLTSGIQAKRMDKDLIKSYGKVDVANFEDRIKLAIRAKYVAEEARRQLAKTGSLPLTHYYTFGKDPKNLIVRDAGFPWLVEFISNLRTEFQQEFNMVVF